MTDEDESATGEQGKADEAAPTPPAVPSQTSKKVRMELRRTRVMALAEAGFSLRQIADQVGVTHSTIDRDIKARLQSLVKDDENTLHQRQMQLRRIETLTRALWVRATGNPALGTPPDLNAMDRIIRLEERRARLLGLDKPAKVEVDGRLDVGGEVDVHHKHSFEREVKLNIHLVAATGAGRNPVKAGEVIEVPADTETEPEDYDA